MASNTLILSTGSLEMEISPSMGGAIVHFDYVGGGRRAAVLRRGQSPLRDVLDAASFPLVPFVNRIRGGRFSFRGREVRLTPNLEGDLSPLHGHGWLCPWKVGKAGPARAVIAFEHEPDEWPWAYEARQEFALDEGGLTLRISCRNRSAEPMPCGLGQHPYFPCGPETRIDTVVAHAWTVDADVLPVHKVPAAGRFDLRDRPVCRQDLDNGFDGWGGSVRISDPEWPFELEMSSPTAPFFQLYSPTDRDIFVAEPVTHANAALNAPEEEWPDLGMQVLEPGEDMTLEMRIAVRPK